LGIHDNNIDNVIGTVLDFDKAVGATIKWIERNGGWQKNVLIVTADHDHYLTLYPNFPGLLRTNGSKELTYGSETDSASVGHSFGSIPDDKYGWGITPVAQCQSTIKADRSIWTSTSVRVINPTALIFLAFRVG
jgi:alkaline phosphatase